MHLLPLLASRRGHVSAVSSMTDRYRDSFPEQIFQVRRVQGKWAALESLLDTCQARQATPSSNSYVKIIIHSYFVVSKCLNTRHLVTNIFKYVYRPPIRKNSSY